MALDHYAANRTGLLLVDPYNDLLSDGGKLWPQAKAVAEAVDLLTHLHALVEAARRAGIVVFYVPHRQWREGNYDGWRHPVESPEGISPSGAPRTVHDPLESHGSRCSAVAMT